MPNLVNIGSRIRILAADLQCSVIFSSHARERMRERGNITDVDVQKVLTSGMAIRCEPDPKKPKLDRITMEGSTTDGLKIRVVVVAYEQQLRIQVVTVMN